MVSRSLTCHFNKEKIIAQHPFWITRQEAALSSSNSGVRKTRYISPIYPLILLHFFPFSLKFCIFIISI